MTTVQINYNNKPYTLEQITPGVLKFNSAFLVWDRAMNEWKYCNKDRLDKLSKAYKSLERLGATYESRSPGAARRALQKRSEPKPEKQTKTETIAVKKIHTNQVTSTGTWINPKYRFPGEPAHVLDIKLECGCERCREQNVALNQNK